MIQHQLPVAFTACSCASGEHRSHSQIPKASSACILFHQRDSTARRPASAVPVIAARRERLRAGTLLPLLPRLRHKPQRNRIIFVSNPQNLDPDEVPLIGTCR